MKHLKIFLSLMFLSYVCVGYVNTVNAQDEVSKLTSSLNGWELYLGGYYPPTTAGGVDYGYQWEETTEAQARREQRIVLCSDMGATDPVIACSGFYLNPDDDIVVRLGRNDEANAEAMLNTRNIKGYGYAERIKRSFVVTEQTTLFTYKYSCVLNVPDSEGKGNSGDHKGSEMPQFSVSVLLETPEGEKVTLPCESFTGGASFNNGNLIRNDKNCRESKLPRSDSPEDYVYLPWKTVSYDLSPYIGHTVTIEIINHDCLVADSKYQPSGLRGGGHKAWGYFWGKLEPLRLIPKNCGNDDALIVAPEGFETYNWYRCDEKGIPLKSEGNKVEIPVNDIVDGAHYCVEMIGSNPACTRVVTDTVLSTIELNADFTYENQCDLNVAFNGEKSYSVRDSIAKYQWDFGDGYKSAEKNPVHQYQQGGNFNVELTVVSGNGCSNSISKPVSVRALPVMNIDGDQNVCQGEKISLSCLSSAVGGQFRWTDQEGEIISNDIQMTMMATTSQTYRVYVIDEYSCEYHKDVDVSVAISPTIFIKGDSSVCKNTEAKLWAWGDADTYVWSTTYVGDTLKFNPQQSSSYCVTGGYEKGCKTIKCVNVIVNDPPTVIASGSEAICEGDQAKLYASGAKEYLWNSVYYGDSLMVSPEKTTTFEVMGTDTNGCTNHATVRVIVNTRPEIMVQGNKPVCEGDPLTLWMEGARSYLWDDGSTESGVTRVPTLQTTLFWVEGETNGCKTRLEIPIVVNPVPTVLIQGKKEICAGENVTLYAQGAVKYEWNTGESESEIDKTLLTTMNFYVKGYSVEKCVSTASFQVKVHPLPEFTIEGPRSVCEGELVTMETKKEEDDCTYQWDNGFIGKTYEALIEDTTKFSVLATDTLYGCKSSKEYTVYSFPFPTVQILGKRIVCQDDILNLSASGAAQYTWSDGATTNSKIFRPDQSFTVWVDGTTNGCTTRAEATIAVEPAPYIWVDGNTTVCFGDTLHLTARGAKKFVWNAVNQDTNYTAVPVVSSTVTVIGENDGGCTARLNIPITVRSNPIVGILGFETVCKDGTITLSTTGTGLVQYTWNTGDIGQQIAAIVPENMTFEVMAWDSFGCRGVGKHKVRTIEPPVVNFTGDTVMCENGIINLSATGAYSYSWLMNGAILQRGDRFNYTPRRTTMIELEGTKNNCSARKEINLIVKPAPELTINGPSSACRNDEIELSVSGADRYEWSTGETTESIKTKVMVSVSYMVTGYDNDGCPAKKTKRIEVYPDLNVSLEEISKTGCPGTPTTVKLHGIGAANYTYSSEPYNPTIYGTTAYDLEALIQDTTEVYVVGMDINGCTGKDTILITPKSSNEMVFHILPTMIEKGNTLVSFNGERPQDSKWTWRAGDGSDSQEGTYVKHTYSEDAIAQEDSFKVVARAITEDGCLYEKAAYVYVWKDLWAPTGFTPNGDGLNDVFRFKGGDFIEKMHFVIYDRIGKIVFEGNSINDEWDGTYSNGKICPQGTYGWTCSYSSHWRGADKDDEYKGFVNLAR